MQHEHRLRHSALTLALALAATACGGTGEGDWREEAISTSREPALAAIGNIPQRGMLVKFWNIKGTSTLPLANIVNVAACRAKTLYAVEKRLAPLQPPAPQPPRFDYAGPASVTPSANSWPSARRRRARGSSRA
jgi:hypothetical protein